jgi:hypothetical protein
MLFRGAMGLSTAATPLYRSVFRSAGVYWTAIVAATALGGYVFDNVTLAIWEANNKGKLFQHVIASFPDKVEEEEEEEE